MMSRLTGGIGGRGPGETKLESNRRRARERITHLETRDRRATASSGRGARQQRDAAPAARGRDRRLHQRRQVHAAEHADRQRGAGRGQAVRHAGPDDAGACGSRASARSSSPTPSASSATCPKDLAQRLPRDAGRAGPRPTCCSTSSTPPTRRTNSRSPRSSASWASWGWPTSRGCWSGTRSTCCRPKSRRSCPAATASDPAVLVSAQDRNSTGPLLDAIEAALWREGRLTDGAPRSPAEAHPA